MSNDQCVSIMAAILAVKFDQPKDEQSMREIAGLAWQLHFAVEKYWQNEDNRRWAHESLDPKRP